MRLRRAVARLGGTSHGQWWLAGCSGWLGAEAATTRAPRTGRCETERGRRWGHDRRGGTAPMCRVSRVPVVRCGSRLRSAR